MKDSITLYRDTETGEIYTSWRFEEDYDDMIADLIDDGITPIWEDFQDFVETSIASGQLEEITANLSDRHHVYQFYYVDEDDVIESTMETYMHYASRDYFDRKDNMLDSFADFLDIPQVDRNAVGFYGFNL